MNVPDDYTIGAELRSSILRLVFTKLEEFVLDIVGLDLVSVEYAGRLKPKDRRMLMQSSSLLRLHPSRQLVKQLSIPVGVTVLGTKDISDFSLSFLMEAMRSKVLSALIIYLKENAGLPDGTIMIADVFDFKDILVDDSTSPPTSKPSIIGKSSSTSSPSVRVAVAQSTEGENGTTTIWTIWWVWSLIGLAVLAVLLCLCCCILRKSKKNEKKSTTEEQDPAMIAWMKTGSTGTSLSKGNAQVIFGLQQEKRYQKQQSQRYDYDTCNDDMFLGQSMGIIRRSESSRHYEEDRQHHRRNSRQRSKPKPKRRRQAEQSLKKKKKKRRRRRNRSKRQDESRSVGQQLLLEEEGQKGSSTLLQIEDAEHHESNALVPYTQNENNNENVAGVELVPYTKPRRRSSIDPEGSSASLAYAELSAADIIRQSLLGLPDEETKEDDAYSVILSGLQSSADDVLAKKKALPKYVKTKSNRKDDEDCPVIFCHDNTDEPSVVTNHV